MVWLKSRIDLYIPLRSDKTAKQAMARYLRSQLYIPLRSDKTLFVIWVVSRVSRLYIPLRSDKTYIRLDTPRCEMVFISHYVQIKPNSSVYGVLARTALYPTTFR